MDEVITKHGTDTFSVVAKVVAHDEFGGFTKMEGLSPIQHFLVRSIMGEIGETWTMYDYQTYGEVDTLPLVEPSPEGVAFPHPQHAHDLLTGWDFCAGIGALGWGANFAGVSLAGHVDEGRLACLATRLNSNAPIIQGDIKNIKTTKQVKSSQPAMEHIRRFAEAKDLTMQDTILELADRSLPTPTLQTWPKSEVDYYPHNLISEWPIWPIKEEQQLKWTEQERNYYDDPTYSQEQDASHTLEKSPFGIRQMAAPMQSAWVTAHLASAVFASQGSRIWTCLALEISGAGYQGQKCSDDSIYGTLQALLKLSNNLGNTPWTALSPREAKILEVAPTELLTQADTFRQTLNFTEKLILVFEDEGHWTVLQVTLEENGLQGKVFNGYPQIPQATYTLMNQIGILWGHQDWHLHLHSWFQQKGDNECGAIVIQHVCRILDLWNNFTDEDTRAWHAHLLSLDTSIHAWRAAGPNPDKLTNDLIAVLQQQGVPANAVEQRASAAIKQI
ncbi:unnamed protein product, partial [Effrenium voratum]